MMKYIKGHLKKNLGKWTGKQWYHQRFDGSPYFLHFIAEAQIIIHKERKNGGFFKAHYCFFDEGKADWFMSIEGNKRITKAVIDASKKDALIGKIFIKNWDNDQKLFYKKCNEIEKTNLSKLSNKELIKLHNDFAQITLNRNSSSSLIDGFALGSDEMIAEQIEAARKKSGIDMKENQVFSILTAPIHLSFINEAEVSLLKIGLIAEKEGLKDIFVKEKNILKKIQGTQTLKALEEHQKKYFWIKNNYVSANIVSVEEFAKELKTVFRSGIDLKSHVEKINSTPETNKHNKADLIKKIPLSHELKVLIEISEDFTYWQDERKKATFWAIHYMSLILTEIGKRLSIDLELLNYTTCREVSNYFNEKPDADELKARKKKSVYFWDEQGMECVYGSETDTIRKTILGETDYSDIDDFRGLTARIGKAVGKVKIVRSATEIDKVKQGDILVAVMTRPDYVPAMKKAGAIVTDEGGITCHAAIVSRELGIPCIIGTKIATKVFKDGDLVEVNANHGWVKKLKSE